MRSKVARRAAFALLIYAGGMLALLFHLATEEHFLIDGCPEKAQAGFQGTSGSSHKPHSASDHEADLVADGSHDLVLVVHAPEASVHLLALPLALPASTRPISWLARGLPRGGGPPLVESVPEQPRAPPAA